MNTGQRLQDARIYLGLHLDQVANATGIPASRLLDIEAGDAVLGVWEIERLAKVYRRPIAWLTGVDPSPPRPTALDRIIQHVGGLTDEDINELERFAEFLRHREETRR